MSDKLPTIHQRTVIAETRFFTIEEVDLEFSNGEKRTFQRLVSSGDGAVLVVPMLDDETILMIKEYGAGLHQYEITLPKGKIDPGETPVEAANRELKEEIGYGANTLTYLRSISLAPGAIQHYTHIVIAQDLYPEKLEGDEPEELEVIPFKLDQIPELACMENCTESRTITALFMLREFLANNLNT